MQAKFAHLHSTTAGHVPASLERGQLAINIPDQIVYAAGPDLVVRQLSRAGPVLPNAAGALGPHIKTDFFPVAQLGPGYSEAQMQSRLVDNGTTATLASTALYIFGRLSFLPQLSCTSSSVGYLVTGNVNTGAVTMAPLSVGQANSGTLNWNTKDFSLVIGSEGRTYPYFYLPQSYTQTGPVVSVYRISPYKTFGAIPVSTGFAGDDAATYWG